MRLFIRLLLAIALAIGLLGPGLSNIATAGARFELAKKSAGAAAVMLAECAEGDKTETLGQTLAENFFRVPPGATDNPHAAANLERRQTNRHGCHNNLYSLKLAFLI